MKSANRIENILDITPLFSEFFISVNPRVPLVSERDIKRYINDYLHILKTRSSVRLVAVENGKKFFTIVYKLIIAVGTKL